MDIAVASQHWILPLPAKLRFPIAVVIGLLVAFAASPGSAQDEVELERIAAMSPKELEAFVDTVTVTVAQDTLKMRNAGPQSDCLELTRTANSFALGYRYLAEANAAIDPETERELLILKARIVQARVLTFAARTRAAEWLRQRCAAFTPPAEQADNPRYQTPAKLQTAEYSEAVIEARIAAEANLAAAMAAARAGRCPEAIAAARGIQLFIPYVDKLLADLKVRPEALGPRASRRGLETARAQLLATFNGLEREYSVRCGAPVAGANAEDPGPVEPASP